VLLGFGNNTPRMVRYCSHNRAYVLKEAIPPQDYGINQ
jgi:hypothetical protein